MTNKEFFELRTRDAAEIMLYQFNLYEDHHYFSDEDREICIDCVYDLMQTGIEIPDLLCRVGCIDYLPESMWERLDLILPRNLCDENCPCADRCEKHPHNKAFVFKKLLLNE